VTPAGSSGRSSRHERLRIFDGRAVREALDRADGRRGAPVLEEILASYEEPPLTHEEIERSLLEACDRAGTQMIAVLLEPSPG
jgi:hypothetical protein